MSAFVVAKEHIDYLVTAGLRYGQRGYVKWCTPSGHRRELAMDTADAVGQMLWNENFRSVNYRYNEKDSAPVYKDDVSGVLFNRIDAVQVLKALNCYEYQCCETPDWKETEAYAFYSSLLSYAIDALPGYDKARWAIDAQRRPVAAGVDS